MRSHTESSQLMIFMFSLFCINREVNRITKLIELTGYKTNVLIIMNRVKKKNRVNIFNVVNRVNRVNIVNGVKIVNRVNIENGVNRVKG